LFSSIWEFASPRVGQAIGVAVLAAAVKPRASGGMPKTNARHPFPPSGYEISAPRLKGGVALG